VDLAARYTEARNKAQRLRERHAVATTLAAERERKRQELIQELKAVGINTDKPVEEIERLTSEGAKKLWEAEAELAKVEERLTKAEQKLGVASPT
jgi:phage-related tail protein